MQKLRYLIITFLLLLVSVSLAQNLVDETCAEFVSAALDSVDDICHEQVAGTACYVEAPVTYTPQEGANFTFEKPKDIAPLPSFKSINTGSFNADQSEWGIVVLAYANTEPDSQANDALDRGLIRYLMIGAVTITDTSADTGLNVMESFTVSTARERDCNAAPNSLLMQTPRGIVFDVTVNGVEVVMQPETTILIEAQPNQMMSFIVVTGEISVTANGTTYVVLRGEQTLVILGGTTGLMVMSPPTAPQVYDTIIIQFIPVRLLTEVIAIPAADRWTGTGIMLAVRDKYNIIATEFMKTIDYMPWTGPEGHSTSDCVQAGRTDWDCRCRSSGEWGICTIDETAAMRLVGRIDETGKPFVVGSGGSFVATSAGELFLGPNDNTFGDNVGSYYVIVTTNQGE